jgi:DNA-binding transcriptional ArsR family regulator
VQDTLYIEQVEQAMSLLKPLRIELLKLMAQPRTCSEMAAIFDQTPQNIYYHVKALEKAGLVEKVAEQRVRGTVEGHYQARARSYWLAPHLIGRVGSARSAQDQVSLRYLLSLAEELLDDVGRLAQRSAVGQDVPSLSLSAQIHLPDGERRAEFLQEVQTLFQNLAEKYGTPTDHPPPKTEDQSFRLRLACYPKS